MKSIFHIFVASLFFFSAQVHPQNLTPKQTISNQQGPIQKDVEPSSPTTSTDLGNGHSTQSQLDDAWYSKHTNLINSVRNSNVRFYAFTMQKGKLSGGCTTFQNNAFDDLECKSLMTTGTKFRAYVGPPQTDKKLDLKGVKIGMSISEFESIAQPCLDGVLPKHSNIWLLGETILKCKGIPILGSSMKPTYAFFIKDRLVFFTGHFYEQTREKWSPRLLQALEGKYGVSLRSRTGEAYKISYESNDPQYAYLASSNGEQIIIATEHRQYSSYFDHVSEIWLIDKNYYYSQTDRLLELIKNRDALTRKAIDNRNREL